MIYYFLPGLAFSGSEDLSEYILKSNLDLKGSQGRGGGRRRGSGGKGQGRERQAGKDRNGEV